MPLPMPEERARNRGRRAAPPHGFLKGITISYSHDIAARPSLTLARLLITLYRRSGISPAYNAKSIDFRLYIRDKSFKHATGVLNNNFAQ